MILENADIVIVDDSPYDLKLITIVLHDLGLNNSIVHLPDGEEALSYFFDQESGPININKTGLIFLDIKMTRIDGIEVLRKLKSNALTSPIPVVMFTSSCQESEILECYSLGANSYIVKPKDFKVFESIIRNVCDYWLKTDFHSDTD